MFPMSVTIKTSFIVCAKDGSLKIAYQFHHLNSPFHKKRKVMSMGVKKEQLITDVIMCVFLIKTFFFSIKEMQLLLFRWYTFISYAGAKLLLNCLKMKLWGNIYHQTDGSWYWLLRAQRVDIIDDVMAAIFYQINGGTVVD